MALDSEEQIKSEGWYTPFVNSDRKHATATSKIGSSTLTHHSSQTAATGILGAKHILYRADSRVFRFSQRFGWLLTSPPYYHPVNESSKHGVGFTGHLQDYVNVVGDVLLRWSDAVVGRRVCFVKTDLWYKGALIPLGWEIARACAERGLGLRAHWIWQRKAAFSPYGPGFSNVFVFADDFSRPHFGGIITGAVPALKKGLPNSFTPGLFGALIELLTKPHDAILDPFAGAGGVIEAAATRHRRSVGIELSRAQFQIAVERLSGIPGFKAINCQPVLGGFSDGKYSAAPCSFQRR
jgi:DNA methylase